MKLKHDLSYLKGKTNKFSETGQLEATFLIDSKPITGLLDTGAPRSLVSLSWLKENFSVEEINKFPRVFKPNIYDAAPVETVLKLSPHLWCLLNMKNLGRGQ